MRTQIIHETPPSPKKRRIFKSKQALKHQLLIDWINDDFCEQMVIPFHRRKKQQVLDGDDNAIETALFVADLLEPYLSEVLFKEFSEIKPTTAGLTFLELLQSKSTNRLLTLLYTFLENHDLLHELVIKVEKIQAAQVKFENQFGDLDLLTNNHAVLQKQLSQAIDRALFKEIIFDFYAVNMLEDEFLPFCRSVLNQVLSFDMK